MTSIKKLAGETVIYGVSHILPRILHFIVFTMYLTRKFPTTEYGIYNDLYAYATILLTLLVYRMDTSFFRFGSNNKEIQKVFSTALMPLLISTVILVGVVFSFAKPIAELLSYGSSVHYIKWFALILGFDAAATLFYGRFRLQNRPIRFLIYRVANVILTIFFVLFFLEILPRFNNNLLLSIGNTLGVSNPLDYVFLSNLIASGLILVLMIPEFLKVQWSFDFSLWKKMFFYALPLVIVSLAGNINQAAVPIQKYFLNDSITENLANAGLYAAAAKIAMLLMLFTTAFNYAAEPFFFNNAKDKDAPRIYGQVALAFTMVASIVIMVIIFYSHLFQLIVGIEYRSAFYVVPILLMAYLFLGLYYNVSIWYKLADKTYIGALISLGGAIVTLVISIILLPHMGKIASAWAALACYSFMCTLAWWTGKKYYPIHYPIAKIGKYILLTTLILFGAHHLEQIITNNWIFMGIGTSIILIYLLFIWLTEKSFIQSIKSN